MGRPDPRVEAVTTRAALHHRTTYRFAEPVHLFPHAIRLRPAPHARTPVSGYELRVEPAEHVLRWHQDPFGGWVGQVVFTAPADELEVTVDLVADLTPVNPFDFFVEDYASTAPFAYPADLHDDLGAYLQPVDDGPRGSGLSQESTAWVESTIAGAIGDEGGELPVVELLVRLNRAVRAHVAYSTRMEPGTQAPHETLERAVGSCRDSSWLLVAVLRHAGLAARFASGYLLQLQTPGEDGPSRDSAELHAWAEAYVPGAGWVGLDPTSGLLAAEGHIPLSCTPRPSSAAPISGTTTPAEVDFSYETTLTRLDDAG